MAWLAQTPGEAVGLQFQRNRVLVPVGRVALHLVPDPRLDAEHVLDVVAVLMCQHVRLRELALSAEPVGELVPEGHVDVDQLVQWAVERADPAVGRAAAGGHSLLEEDGVGVPVRRRRTPAAGPTPSSPG